MPGSRSLMALSLVFYSFHASAFLTNSADKPDPYARRHYTAADLPAAKRAVAAKKAAAKKAKSSTDEEIMAEIEREDAGTEAALPSVQTRNIISHRIVAQKAQTASKSAAPQFASAQTSEPSVSLKVESRQAGPSSDDLEGRRIVAAARGGAGEFSEPAINPRSIKPPTRTTTTSFPPVTVCRFSSLGSKQKRGTIASRYLISDSDGFDACSHHGGEITAGNDDDRSLMNVKDSAILKRAKK